MGVTSVDISKMNRHSQQLLIIIALVKLGHFEESFTIPITNTEDSSLEYVEYTRNQMGCEDLHKSVGEQCKFYGECCGDPVRIRERLPPGTYQCTNIGVTQGYVVDRCPLGTAKELSNLCKQSNSSVTDISLGQWPVTGTYTGITYSNLYCAICNGALSPVTDNDLTGLFDIQKALEFWTMEIYCENSTIRTVETNKTVMTTKMLEKLIHERECWIKLLPTLQPIHRQNCGKDVSTCPKDYRSIDLRILCENGPFNQVCIGKENYPCQDGAYRNSFCKRCWNNKEPTKLEKQNYPEGRLLLIARPSTQTQNDSMNWFSEHSLGVYQQEVAIGLSWRNNDSFYHINSQNGSVAEQEFWNLGSILCYSNLDTVCGEFIVFPDADDSLGNCSAPGCTVNSVQDLTNGCTSINRYSFDTQLVYERKFVWSDKLLGDSLSSCANGNDASNCICDVRCHFFGDCCSDAKPLPPMAYKVKIKQLNGTSWTCHPLYLGADVGLVVIDSCPDNSTEEAALCAKGNTGEWGPFSWLVSDAATRLTYKNTHCANCHGASDLMFWDALMICPMILGRPRGSCLFKEYSPPNNENDLFYPCRLDFDKLITNCPAGYSDWQLSQDCQTEPASFASIGKQVFKNYHCAICHLGDNIESVSLLSYKRTNIKDLTGFIHKRRTIYNNASMNFIILSIEKQTCCVTCSKTTSEQCELLNLDNYQWGSSRLGHNNSCIHVPFNVTCDDGVYERSRYALPKIDFDHLCPGADLSCPVYNDDTITSCVNCFQSTTDPISDIDDPFSPPQSDLDDGPNFGGGNVMSAMFDSDAARSKPVVSYKSETRVVDTNESYQFCSEGAILSSEKKSVINKLFLTPRGILVETSENTSTTQPREKRRFLTHDYVFTTFSLISIAMFIIYTLVTKKKPLNLPDRIMIALLVSLFGALICFSLATTATSHNVISCRVLATLIQFFFLCTLTWSNSMAISIIKSLFTLRLSTNSKLPFIAYSLYSFGLPLICSLITIILSRIEHEKFSGQVYETEIICFIGSLPVLYSCFLVPIYLLIVCNFVIGVIVMVKIAKSGNVGVSHNKNRTQKHIISCLKVSACLGLGWIFLFVATFYDPFWPIMQAMVELQGLFIVLFNLIGWNCINRVKSWSSAWTSDKTKSTTDNGPVIDLTETIALSSKKSDSESNISDDDKH